MFVRVMQEIEITYELDINEVVKVYNKFVVSAGLKPTNDYESMAIFYIRIQENLDKEFNHATDPEISLTDVYYTSQEERKIKLEKIHKTGH